MSQYDNYLPLFLEEAMEHINKLEQYILKIENDNNNPEAINDLFRVVHSLKGSSAMMGLTNMSGLAHSLEGLLAEVRAKRIVIKECITNLFFKCIDLFKDILEELKRDYVNKTEDKGNGTSIGLENGKRNEVDTTAVINEIKAVLEPINRLELLELSNKYKKNSMNTDRGVGVRETEVSSASVGVGVGVGVGVSASGSTRISTSASTMEDIVKDINFSKHQKINKEEEPNSKPSMPTVRVEVAKINKLMNLVSEFIIYKESLNQVGIELKKEYKGVPAVSRLVDIAADISYISSEFQETIMSTRMLPLDRIFKQFPRMVRDMAKKVDKNIEFTIVGQDTEIDREILEELANPITHILRNSIDHGIEKETERLEAGKPALAQITLSASYKNGYIIIEIKDDGRGLNINLIRQRVIENGFATAEEVASMNDDKLISFIYRPGFSTAKEVTDISGRGVGLDVVKSSIEGLNGIVEVKSESSVGTSFIMRLPLTSAIIEGLLIKEQDSFFAVPIHSIFETFRLKNKEVKEKIYFSGEKEVMLWRDSEIPVLHMNKYFNLNFDENKEKCYIIVVGYAEKCIALVTEKILSQQQLVIKSFKEYIGQNKFLGELAGISGVSILGDGNIAQIIDISGMFRIFE